METWSFSESGLSSTEYEFDKDKVIRLSNRETLDGRLYNWMNYKTKEIAIVKAKTIETKEDVIAVYIYYSRKNIYGRSGNYDTSKSYHLYNGKIYGKQGMIKTVPKEVKMSLKEIGIEI